MIIFFVNRYLFSKFVIIYDGVIYNNKWYFFWLELFLLFFDRNFFNVYVLNVKFNIYVIEK